MAALRCDSSLVLLTVYGDMSFAQTVHGEGVSNLA